MPSEPTLSKSLVLVGILALLGVIPPAISAEQAQPNDIVFIAKVDQTEQRYVELLPAGLTPDQTSDVLIALHGHGSDRWQFIQQVRDECRGVRDVAKKHQMILVSPDYRAKTSWMGPLAEADLVQIIDELKQRHRVGKLFLVGGSMGGTAALTFTALHADLVDGVCCLNGTANLVEFQQFQEAMQASFGGTKAQIPDEYRRRSAEFAAEEFIQPVALTTGGNDTIVPPHSALRFASKLKTLQRRVLSLHREQGGHETDYRDTCTALEFVIQQAEKIQK